MSSEKIAVAWAGDMLWWLICAMSYNRGFGAKRRKGATQKPAKWWLFCVFAWRPFAPPGKDTTNRRRKGDVWKCRTFVWRGERSPCENTKKSPFCGFSCGAFSPFRPETIIRHGTNQPPYVIGGSDCFGYGEKTCMFMGAFKPNETLLMPVAWHCSCCRLDDPFNLLNFFL